MAMPTPTPITTRADRVLDAVRAEIERWRGPLNEPSTPIRTVSCIVALDECGVPESVEMQVRGRREVRKRRGAACAT